MNEKDQHIALIARARKGMHKRLLEQVLTISADGTASNADKSSALSKELAGSIARQLESETGEKLAGQTSGNEFEEIIAEFTEATFCKLAHIRSGAFKVIKVGSRAGLRIAQFEQYHHLVALKEATDANPTPR